MFMVVCSSCLLDLSRVRERGHSFLVDVSNSSLRI
jgi:hypothetical protein